jgi:hypothetical protein
LVELAQEPDRFETRSDADQRGNAGKSPVVRIGEKRVDEEAALRVRDHHDAFASLLCPLEAVRHSLADLVELRVPRRRHHDVTNDAPTTRQVRQQPDREHDPNRRVTDECGDHESDDQASDEHSPSKPQQHELVVAEEWK